MNKFVRVSNPRLNFALSILIIAAVNLACSGFKKPWRDYSDKPFSSAEWLAGDKVDRARMWLDFAKRDVPRGKTRDGVIGMLGEPDLKKTVERKEVWFWRVDIGIQGGMDLIPVSFDEKGRAGCGMVRAGTHSSMVKESEEF